MWQEYDVNHWSSHPVMAGNAERWRHRRPAGRKAAGCRPGYSVPVTTSQTSSSAVGPVLVVDFGAQYAQLIARRVREAGVYSEIVPHSMDAAAMLDKRPSAIILSGGPSSVYADGAPSVDPALFDAGVPVLGICYGFQAMAQALGGRLVDSSGRGLSVGMIGTVSRQLARRYAELAQAGLAAGNAAALRVFH